MPPALPTLVYDGDCSFCRRWLRRWQFLTGDRIQYRPYQEAAADFPQIPRENFGHSVYLFEPDGQVSRAAGAVFRSLYLAGQKRYLYRAYTHLPGLARLTELGYRFVASHRDGLDRLDRLLLGDAPVSYRLTRRWFLTGLAIIYLFAFVSLYVQIDGLIGAHGILPAADYMGAIQQAVASRQIGSTRYLLLPTLCWISTSDAFLHALCWLGIASSILLAIGLLPGLAALGCWVCYLSLATVGQVFLGFQWDTLLLEAGFLAIFFVPWTLLLRPRHQPPPSNFMIFLCRWLIFRLMFLSGVVKLASGDVTWRSWQALKYHYETQPLPPWTAWYMHQLPPWFHQISVGFMFLVELLIPFLMFGPRRLRVTAFFFTITLQILIAATGNFGFFNYLAIILCIPLLDDALLPFGRRYLTPPKKPQRFCLHPYASPLVALLILALSIPQVLASLNQRPPIPAFLQPLYRWTDSLHLTSPYGLFAIMTTERPEILVEHSDDGVTWTPYSFKYKPGDLSRPPPFCQPHMPRLDWQLWFAALGTPDDNPWFAGFLSRLLDGEPSVFALLDHPPTTRPHYVRATLYEYHFTTRAERNQTGNWWKRELVGPWFPQISVAPQ